MIHNIGINRHSPDAGCEWRENHHRLSRDSELLDEYGTYFVPMTTAIDFTQSLSHSKNNHFFFFFFKGYNLDQNLNAAQKADVRAYSAMLDEILYSAQLYNWWMEPDNYSTVTHLTFSRALPFPLSWVLPRRMKQRVTARLNSHNMNNAERVSFQFHI